MLSRYHQRQIEEAVAARARWGVDELLFLEQLNVARDTANRRLVDGSRRCGKTFLAAVMLLDAALSIPGARVLYLALTRKDAKDLVWQDILTLNERFKLGGRVNLSALELTLPNRARITIGGAKDRQQAERWRGRFWDLVIIDECQLWPSHLKDLVENVLKPSLLGAGRRGRIVLMGTPGDVPGVGYWEERVEDPRWSKHHWILDVNPWLGSKIEITEFLAEMAEAAGGEDSPEFLREYRGERPEPDDRLDRPFRYNSKRNHFDSPLLVDEMSKEIRHHRWQLPRFNGRIGFWKFVFGIDLGKRAASAIAVLGTCDLDPGRIYLVEEWLAVKQSTDKVYDKIQELRPIYNPLTMCADEGALGVMICDQWRAPPYLLPVKAAEKLHDHVMPEFMSGALSRGDFFVSKKSFMAADMAACRWDKELLKKGKRKIALDPHSDIIPAGRYGFKDAYALAQAMSLEAIRNRPPPPKTDEQIVKEAELAERAAAAARAQQARRGGMPTGPDALSRWRNR